MSYRLRYDYTLRRAIRSVAKKRGDAYDVTPAALRERSF